MKQLLLLLVTLSLVCSCVYENEEEAYYSGTNNQKNTLDSGLIAHFCFQNSLIDSSGHNVVGIFNGSSVYEANSPFGGSNKSVRLNGTDNWFEIPIESHDTITVSMFFIGDGKLGSTVYPSLFDYGKSALTLNLDAVTGGTAIVVNNKISYNMNDKKVCSYNKWVHIYIEFIILQKKITIIVSTIGYDSNEIEQLVLKPDISDDITLKNDSIFIGHSSSNSSNENYFKGLIDDIRIYNRKLNDAELHTITKVLN